jgi:ATP-dependent Lhr-like helicase
MTKGEKIVLDWFQSKGWEAHDFQREAWSTYLSGKNGLLNAPTGSGKTYGMGLGILAEHINSNKKAKGLQAIWITPIRALAKEIQQSLQRASDELDLGWRVGNRTGDTTTSERAKQKKNVPEILITTPESLQLLLASKGSEAFFSNLKCIVNDEWHELMGSKRAVQMELAHSRLIALAPQLKIWGISATIGNMEEAVEVLVGEERKKEAVIIRSTIQKEIVVESILPDEIEQFSWGGHLGIQLLEKVVPLIYENKTTLIFTNTRAQAEIWYQKLLEADPNLAGQLAMHHGSISRELRDWVEDALHSATIKAVVCTSSLDLGVDFRPVDTIIQIGSPKGVARFVQRAGRSGHQPGATSRIYFVPTNSLELIEAAALREAINEGIMEKRNPYFRSFDVLVQYLMTLAVGDGFESEMIKNEVRSTFSFNSMSDDEWNWVMQFLVLGGESLQAYDEYKKVVFYEGLYRVLDRKTAMRHRLSIGTIVSEGLLQVKFMKGGFIGTIEEWFISKLNPGDVFWFSGRNLELIKIKEMQVIVKLSKAKNGKVPSWQGGRMPLSSKLSGVLRKKVNEAKLGNSDDIELQTIQPIFETQSKRSVVPAIDEFLIESFKSKEGHHLYFYPFEGRNVHEGMAALIAYRIGLLTPITFSIAYNDYGFELLSDQEIPIEMALDSDILSSEHLHDDVFASINSAEMARRKFRDIASISGLIFKGYPGKSKKDRHLQASSQLFFDVFQEHEATNLLYLQAYEEVMEFQLEESRLYEAMERIQEQKLVLVNIDKPTPFSFPILVDRLRGKLTTEKLTDRIKRMQLVVE